MAIAFSTIGSLTFVSNSTSVSRPTVSDGDLMLLLVDASYSDADVTPPAGWTAAATVDNESLFETELRLYWKIAASEPSSYTVQISGQGGGNNIGSAIIWSYTGVHATTPVDVSATTRQTSSSTSATAPSVTTTQADTMLICIAGVNNTTAVSFTAPGGMTERFDGRHASAGQVIGIFEEAIASAGATGTRVATCSASNTYQLISIALAPAGGGGGGGGQPPRSMHLSRLMRA